VFWQIVFFSAAIGILSFTLMGAAEKIFMPQKRRRRAGATAGGAEAEKEAAI
jgi:hypothetical protein